MAEPVVDETPVLSSAIPDGKGIFAPYPVAESATRPTSPILENGATNDVSSAPHWSPPAHFARPKTARIDGIAPKKPPVEALPETPEIGPVEISHTSEPQPTTSNDKNQPEQGIGVVLESALTAPEEAVITTQEKTIETSSPILPKTESVYRRLIAEGDQSAINFERYLSTLEGLSFQEERATTPPPTIAPESHDSSLDIARIEPVSEALQEIIDAVKHEIVNESPQGIFKFFEGPLFMGQSVPVEESVLGLSTKSLDSQRIEDLESKFSAEFIENLLVVHTISPVEYFTSAVLALTPEGVKADPLYVWEQLGQTTVDQVLFDSSSLGLLLYPSEEAKKQGIAIDLRETASEFAKNLIRAHLLTPTIDWDSTDVQVLKPVALHALDKMADERIRMMLS